MSTAEPSTNSTESNTNTTNTETTSQSLPSSSSQQHCANCDKLPETTLKECNKCHSVSYCSRDCQKADLKKHKKVCAAAAQVYAQTAEFKPQVTRVVPEEGRRRGLQKWQFDT